MHCTDGAHQKSGCWLGILLEQYHDVGILLIDLSIVIQCECLSVTRGVFVR